MSENNTYKVLNKFACCNQTMVIVIIEGKAACIMTEYQYKRLIRMSNKVE